MDTWKLRHIGETQADVICDWLTDYGLIWHATTQPALKILMCETSVRKQLSKADV